MSVKYKQQKKSWEFSWTEMARGNFLLTKAKPTTDVLIDALYPISLIPRNTIEQALQVLKAWKKWNTASYFQELTGEWGRPGSQSNECHSGCQRRLGWAPGSGWILSALLHVTSGWQSARNGKGTGWNRWRDSTTATATTAKLIDTDNSVMTTRRKGSGWRRGYRGYMVMENLMLGSEHTIQYPDDA